MFWGICFSFGLDQSNLASNTSALLSQLMVHWYPKMGVVKENGRGQLKNFPARKRADQHTYISPPTRKHLLMPLDQTNDDGEIIKQLKEKFSTAERSKFRPSSQKAGLSGGLCQILWPERQKRRRVFCQLLILFLAIAFLHRTCQLFL